MMDHWKAWWGGIVVAADPYNTWGSAASVELAHHTSAADVHDRSKKLQKLESLTGECDRFGGKVASFELPP